MSIILSLGDLFARLVQSAIRPRNAFSNFIQDSECGGRVLDGLVLWILALVIAGISQLTVATKLVPPYSQAHSLVATVTVTAILFAFFAPMVGFFWGPTSKGGRRESVIDLNQTVPAPTEGYQLCSGSRDLGQVVAASIIISLCGLIYLPFKLVGFWLPWTLLALGIGLKASQWMEVNFENKTVRRFAFFYCDSWTIEQQELATCRALIWGGHETVTSEYRSHHLYWLTVLLNDGHTLKIHSQSELVGASINTPPNSVLELAENLAIPLWIPRENVPIEDMVAKFIDDQAKVFKVWGEPSPEPQSPNKIHSAKTEKSQHLVIVPDNSMDEIDLE